MSNGETHLEATVSLLEQGGSVNRFTAPDESIKPYFASGIRYLPGGTVESVANKVENLGLDNIVIDDNRLHATTSSVSIQLLVEPEGRKAPELDPFKEDGLITRPTGEDSLGSDIILDIVPAVDALTESMHPLQAKYPHVLLPSERPKQYSIRAIVPRKFFETSQTKTVERISSSVFREGSLINDYYPDEGPSVARRNFLVGPEQRSVLAALYEYAEPRRLTSALGVGGTNTFNISYKLKRSPHIVMRFDGGIPAYLSLNEGDGDHNELAETPKTWVEFGNDHFSATLNEMIIHNVPEGQLEELFGQEAAGNNAVVSKLQYTPKPRKEAVEYAKNHPFSSLVEVAVIDGYALEGVTVSHVFTPFKSGGGANPIIRMISTGVTDAVESEPVSVEMGSFVPAKTIYAGRILLMHPE